MTVTSRRTCKSTDNDGTDFVPLPGRQVALSMVCVALVMFLGALGQTIVATALPRLVADLGGFDRYAWVATAYMVAATIAAPIGGGLSDDHGRKPFFILGLSIFIAASFLLGTSESMNEVIVFRGVQGIGGGLIMTCSLTAVADLFPPEERGRYQGLLAGVYGIASIVGPVLGGLVTDYQSWNWIFLLNIPIAVPVLLWMIFFFPDLGPKSANRKVDYTGIATLILALVPLLSALSIGGVRYAWSSPQCVGLLAFGIAMAGMFVVVETRAERPIMPMDLYSNRAVALGMPIVVLTGFGLYGSLIFLPLYFQGVLELSAASSGNLLIPMLPGIVLGGILSGVLLSRTGGHYRLQVLVGTGLTTIGMILISTMDETTGIFLTEAYLVVAGLGFGATLAAVSVAVQNTVPSGRVGSGTAANQFYRSVGGMMGLAVMGVMMTVGFWSRLETTVSDELRRSLPRGLLDSIKDNPQALLDPSAAESLRERLAETGAGGAGKVDLLLNSLNIALEGALSDVFAVLVVAAALSFGTAVFFRVPTDAERTRRPG